MTQQTEQPETEDTAPTYWATPEAAVPALEAFLFPAPADTNQESEPSPAAEAPAEAAGEPETQPEAEVASEGESEPEPTEEATSEPPQPRTLRVKIDDAEEEVTEDELVKGYQRQADYTRKTQKLAEERKAFEAEQAALRERAERYAQHLHLLEQALKPAPAPTPDTFADPSEFAAAFAQWQHGEMQRQAVQAEREQAASVVAEQRAKEMAKQLAAEREKLLAAAPDLRDEAKARQLSSYLKNSYGFTDEEIAATTRHELIVMARKAMLYDEAMKPKAAAKPTLKPQVKPAKPGAAATTKPPKSAAELAAQRLQRTGRIEDAAKAFEHLFSEE